jgi:hypothetical protein
MGSDGSGLNGLVKVDDMGIRVGKDGNFRIHIKSDNPATHEGFDTSTERIANYFANPGDKFCLDSLTF